MVKVATVFGLLLFSATSLVVHHLINDAVVDPYMDEIFHVPQTKQFCAWNFTSWDPKITTLPGAYFSILPFLKFVQLFVGSDVCTTYAMRSVTLLYSFLNVILIHQILEAKWKYEIPNTVNHVVATLSIATLPVLYFFSFLYYTDVFSTFFILVAYKGYTLSMSRKLIKQPLPWATVISQMAGGFAVFVRQTNIIWLTYIMLDQLIAYAYRYLGRGENFGRLNRKDVVAGKIKKSRELIEKDPLAKKHPELTDSFLNFAEALTEYFNTGYYYCFILFGSKKLLGYGIVDALFILFVFLNGGIVVGDKKAHQVSVNIPQLYYFFLFTAVMTFPLLIPRIRMVLEKSFLSPKHLFSNVFWTIIALVIIYVNTVAHPYLLADNRHYTFYVWKRLIEWYPMMRYALAPLYILAFRLFVTTFENVSFGFKLPIKAFLFCCACNLIPQLLLEFRYFIPCYIIYRLNINEFRLRYLLLQLLWFSILNGITIYLFLYKPFSWPNVDSPQRFMW